MNHSTASTARPVITPQMAFSPPGWLANAHLQSILPSLKLRRPLLARRVRAMLACSQAQLIDWQLEEIFDLDPIGDLL